MQNKESIEEVKKVVEKMSTGNELLNVNLRKSLDKFQNDIENMYDYKTSQLQSVTGRYIADLKLEKEEMSLRQKSYMKRGKIIDYLVYVNLAVTPILFAYIVYFNYFK